jgi:hypothetical protein
MAAPSTNASFKGAAISSPRFRFSAQYGFFFRAHSTRCSVFSSLLVCREIAQMPVERPQISAFRVRVSAL